MLLLFCVINTGRCDVPEKILGDSGLKRITSPVDWETVLGGGGLVVAGGGGVIGEETHVNFDSTVAVLQS